MKSSMKTVVVIVVLVLRASGTLAQVHSAGDAAADPPGLSVQHSAGISNADALPAPTGSGLTLEQLENIAEEKNPTLRQAAAEIRAARGRQVQAGLYPNPVAGYSGEEMGAGTARGGRQGVFVEQDVVLG